MAQAAEASEQTENPKKVREIAKGFSELGDEMLAHKIQSEEYNKKHEWNRGERQVARQDVPLAMQAHSEEEINLQRENLERLERLKKLAEKDAELAKQIQENEVATLKRKKTRNAEDVVTLSTTMDFRATDEETAHLLAENEKLKRQKDRVQQEIRDHELAMELHNREVRTYQGSSRTSETWNSHDKHINRGKLGGKVISLKEFSGFEVGDGISEEEKRELIRMQDEELARALQMSEEMKVMKRQMSNGEMERRDAELAQLIQQTEKLRLEKQHSTNGGRSSVGCATGMQSGEYLVPMSDRRGACPFHSVASHASTFSSSSTTTTRSPQNSHSLECDAFASSHQDNLSVGRSGGQQRDSKKAHNPPLKTLKK